MQRLCIKHGTGEYFITVGEGLLSHADEYMNLSRKALIVTDSGVPREYAEAVLSKCLDGEIITVDEGESSKSFERLSLLIDKMLDMGMDRTGCVIAVGGGVVGDLAAFAASVYMRGIDFYNIPTTLLAQVDSSVGGKCAVNFSGIKNIVGAFYPPRAVLIDTLTLKTLPKR
ncbi:MAG: iron-containing alcohol dehydrogenase, partial [Clostridia bacterium]|nr:iron-containing alcohol dehydrogenase [Clostridia bacterium]